MAENEKSRYLTTGERVGSFLGWAFVIALLIHGLIVPFLRPFGQPQEEQTEPPVTIQKQHVKPPPTPPPPTPTPPPTPQPQQTPQRQQQNPRPLKLNVVHVHNGAGPGAQPAYHPPAAGSQSGVYSGTGRASPGPVATTASCPDPNREAHTINEATPDYPESAQELGLGHVEVTVVVTIGATGNLESAIVASGSGNSAIDHDALRVARLTTYAPKLENCQPVESQYRYLVDYNPE